VICFKKITVDIEKIPTVKRDCSIRLKACNKLITNQLLYQLSYKGILKNLIYIAELNRKILFGFFFVSNFPVKTYESLGKNIQKISSFLIFTKYHCKLIGNKGQLTLDNLVNLSYNLCIR